ncbi:N-acetylmannosamine-6-phosphate 2-epimerase [Luteitalea sp.]|uniref:N-acetylmannosamine-6-phosphate 2-epimerase n=1 Tax=Luteitalea sp. TaxID=2004800 RepID=UPI0025BEB186|nr:N-acetylmannosamine-6-phosphate 2-epimerase [Luteitalea sp.]
MIHSQQLLAHLRNRLIVSCQAPAESPLHDPYVIARLARAAELQGAGGVRIDSPAHVAATRALVGVPIIGLHKQTHDGSAVYITPTCGAAAGVVEAGADIVAVDATARHRPHGERLVDIIGVIKAHGRLVMADVATETQGLAAADLGVDLIATTLSGYTEDSLRHPGPDLVLVERLATATRLPVVAEGRIRSASDVRAAFRAGAYAVVVGGAITGIDALVRHFVEATPAGLAETTDA